MNIFHICTLILSFLKIKVNIKVRYFQAKIEMSHFALAERDCFSIFLLSIMTYSKSPLAMIYSRNVNLLGFGNILVFFIDVDLKD